MIKKIEIVNVKGIGLAGTNGIFEFDIIPNKPAIFVAPNGYGKTSFALAFNSLNNSRIDLPKEQYHKNDENNKPSITLNYIDTNNVPNTLRATHTQNDIKNDFDWFVINNQVFAKAKKSKIQGNIIASASLDIPPIVLINSIPPNIAFNYSFTNQKREFGTNGKILPNISALFQNKKLLSILFDNLVNLERIYGQTELNHINNFIAEINGINDTQDNLLNWIENNKLDFLNNLRNISQISSILSTFDLGFNLSTTNFLAAYQLAKVYNSNKGQFTSALKRTNYELEKENYEQIFSDFNTSWQKIKPSEKDGALILEFPKNNFISNGERDILCLIGLLKKVELKFKKSNCILIVDEVFDYLDEANLIAAQYYITQFINIFKEQNKFLYPIILTHLNPFYFKNFVFGNQKVHYLFKNGASINPHFRKFLLKRDDDSIKDEVSMHHLHYHPNHINIRHKFEALGLKPTWGDSSIFDNYIYAEFIKYSLNDNTYDPFAVCCAVRKKIENKVYNKIVSVEFRNEYLVTHKTPNKLAYAEEKGVILPETYYLLGIIYNDGLHYKNNESAIASKLENITVRKMICDLDK
jgi:hypothetical protein